MREKGREDEEGIEEKIEKKGLREGAESREDVDRKVANGYA